MTNRKLIEIPEWLHHELKNRSKLQWEAMQPVMGYNQQTKQYQPTDIEGLTPTPEHVEMVYKVQSLYTEPIVDPDGKQVEMNEDIYAWWDEYSIQCAMFPDSDQFEEAKREVANFYNDGKRFTMARWFQLKAEEEAAQNNLN